ncbi:NAD(P)H-hydrate dehydratase [Actimicrobium sp. CCC2.4]|uniref:NAD(P)H-hydrate dehydratase n=1 Tax=Actimicrobium sp. CCC2.4 TaxID=3048606 RepID=UPI002AC901D0|nr:NAD(P)H-hydrate dehydratase [Actimicrobium sp. CCC2.4]MEB0134835.1 NAD(P)H-hydrate dehydratase [Actimicrobium sp. CCC2.4]WPX30769.1 NAD(P)H-hydrate dehydratase [Actimicrobium sp. CCC2.4]
MHALYSVAALRRIEQAALQQVPAGTLMQRAGLATSSAALALLTVTPVAASILVLAGPGNNGGDALDAAARLAEAGASVSIHLCADPERLPADAQDALQRARQSTAVFVDALPPVHWSLVIDGLFGIGLARPIAGAMADLIRMINRLDLTVLAIDVPSGLDADNGALVGDVAIRASHTITFIGDKPGLHTLAGREQAGTIFVEPLGIDAALYESCALELSGPALFASAVHTRSHASHKGSYGDVMVLGGADGMTGATILAARCALHAGAGKVHAAFIGSVPAFDPLHPELMCRSAGNIDFGKAVLVAGPGLGTGTMAAALLLRILQSSQPLVLDADALNLVAADPALQQRVARHPATVLLTPHPLEAARLLGCTVGRVQADRTAAAAALAVRLQAVVILKGSGSIIARPDGHMAINPSGNPALASGGTGDVLAGLCGALLAQGWPAWEAATGATWLHGHAADVLVRDGHGPIGLNAGELLLQIRRELNLLKPLRQNTFMPLRVEPAGPPQW